MISSNKITPILYQIQKKPWVKSGFQYILITGFPFLMYGAGNAVKEPVAGASISKEKLYKSFLTALFLYLFVSVKATQSPEGMKSNSQGLVP